MAGQPDREAIERAQQVLYDEGMKIREQVLGSEHVKNSRSLPPLQQPVQSLAVSAGWSMCWTRPGLERKTRSLITVSLLTALGQDHELGAHVKGAINNGCTPEEIMEAIYQVCAGILGTILGRHTYKLSSAVSMLVFPVR